MNNEINDLIEMFGKSFPEKTITKIYDENHRNLDLTITNLLDLTESVNGSKKEGFNPSSNGSSTKSKTMKSSNTSKKTKPPSFQRFKEEFIEILSKEEIDEIWAAVQKLCWGNKLTAQQHYEMAQSTAEEKIAEKFDNLKNDDDTSSGALTDDVINPTSKELADFSSYIDLFHGLIAQNLLEEIWQKTVHSSSIIPPLSPKGTSSSSNPIMSPDTRFDSQEKMEAAILNALNYLEEKDRVEAGRDDPTLNIDNSLTTYLANQELQRCSSKSKKHSSSSLSQAQREDALAYVLDLFSSASPVL